MKKLYLIQISLIVMMLYIITSVMNAQPAELLVHYKLDDASGVLAADASGNGHDGNISGTPKWVDGTIDGAFEFSGTEAITLPGAAMAMTSDMGSVAYWMNCDVPTQIYTMFWAGDNTTGGGFGPENEIHIHLESAATDVWMGGELSCYIRADPNPNLHLHSDPDKSGADNPGAKPVNPTLMGDKAWHHVAATWGNGMAKLYIDGSVIMEAAYVSTSYALTNIYLGQMANAGRTYTGILDDVRIYNGILTDIEIGDLFMKISATHDIENRNNLSFYPNPALDLLNINFVSKAGKSADISLLNLVGQEVTNKSVSTVTGTNNLTLSLDGIAAGIYFVRLELDNEVTVEKVRVE